MNVESAPKKSFELVSLVIIYSIVIAATLWWSGHVTSPSVYDRFHARLEGVTLAVRDTERTRIFFESVLNFQRAAVSERTLLLPDRRKLFLHAAAEPAPSEIVLRVRNGFPRLYDELRTRLESSAAAAGGPQLTPIEKRAWGDEFILTDFDGNRFVYFRPQRRLSVRGE